MNFERPYPGEDSVVGPAGGGGGNSKLNSGLVEDIAYQATLRAEERRRLEEIARIKTILDTMKVGATVSFQNPHSSQIENDWSIESIIGNKEPFDKLNITLKKNGEQRLIKVLKASEINLIKLI